LVQVSQILELETYIVLSWYGVRDSQGLLSLSLNPIDLISQFSGWGLDKKPRGHPAGEILRGYNHLASSYDLRTLSYALVGLEMALGVIGAAFPIFPVTRHDDEANGLADTTTEFPMGRVSSVGG
jgi:hypothetical protein